MNQVVRSNHAAQSQQRGEDVMHTMEVSRVELVQLIEGNDSVLRRVLKLLARRAIHAGTTVPIGASKRRVSLLHLALFVYYGNPRLREVLRKTAHEANSFTPDQLELVWQMVEGFLPDPWQVPALYEELICGRANPTEIVPWALASIETKLSQQASVYRRESTVA